MAYWLAEQHLSLDKDGLEYRSKLYNYFRSEAGGDRDVECITTVYMVEQDTVTNNTVLTPYTLCLLSKDAKSKNSGSFLDYLEARLYKLGAGVFDFTTITHFTKGSSIILGCLSDFEYYRIKLGLLKETVVNKLNNREQDVYSFALFSNVKDSEFNTFTLECFKTSSSEEPGFNLTLNRKTLDLSNRTTGISQVTSGGYKLNIPGDSFNVVTALRLKELIYSVFCVGITEFDPSIVWTVDYLSNEGKLTFNVSNDETITKVNGSNKIDIREGENITLTLTVNRMDRRDFLKVIKELDILRVKYEDIKSDTEILSKKRSLLQSIKSVKERLKYYDTPLQVLEYL